MNFAPRLGIGLLLPLFFLCLSPSMSIAQASKQAAVPVVVVPVALETFRDRTEALGNLRANESVDITANVTETVTAIYFEDGQRIQAEKILVEMTSAEERALLEEAKTNVTEAKRQLDRIRPLASEGRASVSLLDERLRNYEAAQARLIAMQSRLKDRVITAPFSGRLGLRNISLGTLVRPGDLITTLTDNSRMKLDFNVPALLLPKLKVGLPIVANTRAYPAKKFDGRVVSIDNQIDLVTRSIRVRALLPNDDRLLKQGMLMTVDLFYDEREALVIPEEAIVPEAGKAFVFVVNSSSGNADRRQITIGARRAGAVEVLEGLQDGELVVTHGAFKLRPGTAISVVKDQLGGP